MTTKKVVIVTGASSGIGEATSRMLINGGAKVMLVARREDKLKKIAEELGEDAHYHVADVANHKEMLKMSEETLSLFGRVDVLVNNAGIMPLSLISSRRVSEWDETIDVNIKGVLYGIDSVLNHMLERESGHIINVSSVAGHRSGAMTAVYSGTKFAVRAISEGLRQELANKVRVTNISPGAVTTELGNSIKDETVMKAMLERLNHDFLDANDIASAICYCINQPESVSVNEMIIRPSSQEM
ncbi:MAG: SDR family oxidoreductase [SAR86 cluster bacterium]|nr:SDR family oxidoreductase [SAR86 cluster bacterium]|tara:strand:+ start:4625 stop:5350 length:726 start_codon:yes stop_codon:yes gene_type:complete